MASSGVNVKMGVSGVAQFKQAMTQAKQATKTLDAQLALTEKQFKASGDAESYMTEKSELLQSKLESQKTVLSSAESALKAMAEKGIDRSSKAYQDMYRQMIQAKGEILDTESAIDGVAVAGEDAAQGVSDMNEELSSINTGVSFQNVTNGLQSITEGLEKAAKKAYKVGSAIVKQVLGVGTWADDVNTRAKVLGVSPEDLQRMEKTARLIDTDAETIIKARQKLDKNLGNGNKGATTALEALGISTEGNTEDIFWKAGKALMNLGDEAEQEAKANAIFGRSWHELIPLFDAGREEYDKMNASWNVMSEEQLNQLNEMDDEYQRLQMAVEDLKREALSNLAEPMAATLETVNSLLGEITKWISSEEGQKVIGDIVNGIKQGLEWISNNKQAVVTALGAIGVGFVGLKAALMGLNIAKTVDGMKNLFNWGAGKATGQKAAQQAAPAAASSGGWMTGAWNTATAFAGKAAGTVAQAGNMLPGVIDAFMNQTNAGRALRDGGDVLKGLQQDVNETVEGVKKNAETFDKDWNDNVLTNLGKNNILFWDRQQKILQAAEQYAEENKEVIPDIPKSEPTANWEFGDDWSIEEQLAYVDRMTQLAEEQTEASKVITDDLPSAMEQAAERGIAKKPNLIRVMLDGTLIKEYVDQALGAALAGMYDQ